MEQFKLGDLIRHKSDNIFVVILVTGSSGLVFGSTDSYQFPGTVVKSFYPDIPVGLHKSNWTLGQYEKIKAEINLKLL